MGGINRSYASLIGEYLGFFPAVVIIGPRQCGKTTLLKAMSRGWTLYDLELSADFDYVKSDPDLFFQLNTEQIAIDEAQLIPELFSAMRIAIDSNRQKTGRYLITGSSSPDIIEAISESLAGRVGIIEMAPLSLSEAAGTGGNKIADLFEKPNEIDIAISRLQRGTTIEFVHEYWFRGGYPEPWVKQSGRFSDAWLSQYVRTYIERDISRLFPVLNKERYRFFIEMLSGLSGSIINYSEVARALGVSQTTVREYFRIAHGTFVWRSIPAYEKNIKKRVVKHPKGYLRDTGVLHFLMRIKDLRHLLTHPKMGYSWETLVSEEIIRNMCSAGIPFDYYYYRTANGAEIDLILEGKFGVIPIEIKYTGNVKPLDLRSIKIFTAENDCPFGLVINNDTKARMYAERIFGIPITHLV